MSMVYLINCIVMLPNKRKLQAEISIQHNSAPKDLRLSAFYEASPIDSFLLKEMETPYSPTPSIRVTSDIYMLFNQQRLDRMSREALLSHFDRMSARSASFSELKSKLTDDQLISIVKSRYIQSPSELLSWSNYLNTLANEELQVYVARQQASSAPAGMDDNPSPASAPSQD